MLNEAKQNTNPVISEIGPIGVIVSNKREIKLKEINPEEDGKDETPAKKRLAVDVVRSFADIPPFSEVIQSDYGVD